MLCVPFSMLGNGHVDSSPRYEAGHAARNVIRPTGRPPWACSNNPATAASLHLAPVQI